MDGADGENESVASNGAEYLHDVTDRLSSLQMNNAQAGPSAESLIEQMNSLSRLGDPPRAFTEPTNSPSDSANDASPASEPVPSGLLRLVNRPTAAAEQERRTRRFSDADRTGNSFDTTRDDLVPLNDRTRSSLLTLPDAQLTSPVKQRGPGATSRALPLVPHECDAAECAVSKAFGTTELFECILSWIETREIRNLCRVSRAWNGTVKASPQLRLHLFALPRFRTPAADFELLPLSLSGLSVTLASALQKKAPNNVPIKHEELYITQPPVCAVQAFLYPQSSLLDSAYGSGEAGDEEEPSACAKLSCDTGVTLGFLAEMALSILPAPSASGRLTFKELAERKKSEKQVMFKAIMSFTDEHAKERRRRGGNKQFILLEK
ncbi:hypothetical protein EJ03DRAFT_348707 [Teratosphaeria nubilosa]|uniref:F-box domain-containing protein n=1 Tax=Teratosphaeria nubilosa TaxID=161662 RepID=A0A6G1LIT0_9PEZI|nr:hypothetical protein EJ03DRAFT_348707 [Teratosphaeria nubilosa]